MGWTAFHCSACNLVVEVGCDVYWSGGGCFSQVACRRCATIHKIVHPSGCCDSLFAQSGPITYDLSDDGKAIVLGEWIKLRRLPTRAAVQIETILPRRIAAVAWQSLACHCCGTTGELASPDDGWPNEDAPCPRCATGHLRVAYVAVT